MGRRRNRENQRTARQASLYAQQSMPVITNEMLEEAFGDIEESGRKRRSAQLIKDGGCLLLGPARARRTLTVHFRQDMMAENIRDSERADVAVLNAQGKLFFAARPGHTHAFREGRISRWFNIQASKIVGQLEPNMPNGVAMLKLYGVQGGTTLYEIITEEA